MLNKKKSSLSIVSHGQFKLIKNLLSDLENYSNYILEIILTLNIPEDIDINSYSNNIIVIKNNSKKGFGENHNYAFQKISGDYFFIINPDIRIKHFDFTSFIQKLEDKSIGVLSPIVLNQSGEIEDHVRDYPDLQNLFSRFLKKQSTTSYLNKNSDLFLNKWIAGMFMAFKSIDYERLRGFDERFYMYLEDVDICRRVNYMNLSTGVDNKNFVIHDARRDSHRKIKLFLTHCQSYFKFFKKWNF